MPPGSAGLHSVVDMLYQMPPGSAGLHSVVDMLLPRKMRVITELGQRGRNNSQKSLSEIMTRSMAAAESPMCRINKDNLGRPLLEFWLEHTEEGTSPDMDVLGGMLIVWTRNSRSNYCLS